MDETATKSAWERDRDDFLKDSNAAQRYNEACAKYERAAEATVGRDSSSAETQIVQTLFDGDDPFDNTDL